MKKDGDARETEEILRDSRDTHRNRLVLLREIDRCSLHGQEQRNLIREEEVDNKVWRARDREMSPFKDKRRRGAHAGKETDVRDKRESGSQPTGGRLLLW
jgi:hypothetical protein